MVAYVTESTGQFSGLLCRRLVEMAGHIIMSVAPERCRNGESLRSSAKVYVQYAESEISRHETYIRGLDVKEEAYLEAFRPCCDL